MKNVGIYKKEDLANYITGLYAQDFSEVITSIRLQKAMYFLFAYWAGFNNKLKDEEKEQNYNAILFLFEKPKFQARQFGPIELDIYKFFKEKIENNNLKNIKLLFEVAKVEIGKNSEAKKFIDDFLKNNVFRVSDFSLVRNSHKNNTWKMAWHKSKNGYMAIEKIIDEYTDKLFDPRNKQ